jgi:hypothetical protein
MVRVAWIYICILSLLASQSGRAVAVCRCTGIEVSLTALIAPPAVGKACPPCCKKKVTVKKNCYAIKGCRDHQTVQVLVAIPFSHALILASHPILPASWALVFAQQIHLLQPRIREPDPGGHGLRAPPDFA